jgi:hypothetical protein
MLVNVFIALSAVAVAITVLTIREDIPVIVGSLLGAIMSAVAGLNALELKTITNTGNKVVINPEVDLALIFLFVFLINVIFLVEKAVGEVR